MSKLPYKKYHRYPHLMPNDVRIWNIFLEKNPDFFSEVEYDVKVGEGRDYSMYKKDSVREDMEYLSKKRIDVVGYKGNDIYVIELKPKAGLSAIGQVFGMASLFKSTFSPGQSVIAAIITDEEMPDVRSICKEIGVSLLIV